MNILKINGEAISGIYVDAAVSFNKPAKRVQSISVPGRNGNLIIDEGAFDNVLISYPVYEKNSFPMEFDSIVNWLASLEGYQRIECSNDPTHFRLGRFVVPQTPTAKRLNRDGYYQLSFDCKPQRYLNLGEVPTEIDANPSETYGPADIVSFEAAQEDTISGAEFSIVPQQDLHGYDNPWPAGGGKNLLPNTYTTTTINGVTFTVNADGTVDANGTATADTDFIMQTEPNFRALLTSGTNYIINGCPSGGSTSTYFMRLNVAGISDTGAGANINYTGQTLGNFSIRIVNGYTANHLLFKPMLRLASVADATFAPYSNECPISGFTGAEITADGKNLVNINSQGRSYGTVTFDYSGSTLKITGTSTSTGTGAWIDDGFVIPAGTYTLSTDFTGLVRILIGGWGTVYSADNEHPRTFTLTKPTKVTLGVNLTAGETYDITIHNQLELGSTATTYEPFVGATHDITWQDEAGTIYGGNIAYLGGDAWRLTSYNKKLIMDDDNWAFSSATKTFYKQLSDNDLAKKDYTATFEGISDAFKPHQLGDDYSTGNYVGYYVSGTVGIRFSFPSLNGDVNAFATYIDGKEVVYPLATPQVYDLTGEELARLVGQNNVFANCGQSTVVITEPTYFENPGYFTSKPIIRVYGDGTFRVGDNIITIEEHDEPYIDIDSELQDCYCGDTNMNEYVAFTSGEYPVLVPGSNYVLMGEGITKLVITPNWWEL